MEQVRYIKQVQYIQKRAITAYSFWLPSYGRRPLDRHVQNFLTVDANYFGWLRRARQALQLTQQSVADTLGVTRCNYTQLEAREKEGKITLEKLAQAAAAMDCELVYAIRPKQKVLFSQCIWNRVVDKAKGHPWYLSRPERLKERALAWSAKRAFYSPSFRRQQGWTERWRQSYGRDEEEDNQWNELKIDWHSRDERTNKSS